MLSGTFIRDNSFGLRWRTKIQSIRLVIHNPKSPWRVMTESQGLELGCSGLQYGKTKRNIDPGWYIPNKKVCNRSTSKLPQTQNYHGTMTITDALQTVTWNVVRKLNVYSVKRSNPHGTLSQTSETDCVNGRDTVSVESQPELS